MSDSEIISTTLRRDCVCFVGQTITASVFNARAALSCRSFGVSSWPHSFFIEKKECKQTLEKHEFTWDLYVLPVHMRNKMANTHCDRILHIL